jgi:hypothetical protein
MRLGEQTSVLHSLRSMTGATLISLTVPTTGTTAPVWLRHRCHWPSTTAVSALGPAVGPAEINLVLPV